MRRQALFGRTMVTLGLLLALLAVLAACGTLATPASTVAAQPNAARQTTATATTTRGQPATATGKSATMPTIAFAQLPPEAQATIRLIDKGGPFPYSKDGTTFGNREGLLPPRPDGYYREYTVDTPGSADRGARRIISGRGGELYYTDDHYNSFKQVVR